LKESGKEERGPAMNICDSHFFWMVIMFVVVFLGIISIIKEEKNG